MQVICSVLHKAGDASGPCRPCLMLLPGAANEPQALRPIGSQRQKHASYITKYMVATTHYLWMESCSLQRLLVPQSMLVWRRRLLNTMDDVTNVVNQIKNKVQDIQKQLNDVVVVPLSNCAGSALKCCLLAECCDTGRSGCKHSCESIHKFDQDSNQRSNGDAPLGSECTDVCQRIHLMWN